MQPHCDDIESLEIVVEGNRHIDFLPVHELCGEPGQRPRLCILSPFKPGTRD